MLLQGGCIVNHPVFAGVLSKIFGNNCGACLQKPKELFESHITAAKEQKFPIFPDLKRNLALLWIGIMPLVSCKTELY